MNITLMKSKIHRATVTMCELHYEGSIAIDADLMKAANIRQFEQVDVLNINNGERFTTYAIPADGGSGTIGILGAAAHKAKVGDLVIILAYGQMTEQEAEGFKPNKVICNDNNGVKRG